MSTKLLVVSIAAGLSWVVGVGPAPSALAQAPDLTGFIGESGLCAYAKADHGVALARVLDTSVGIFQSPPRVYPDYSRPEYVLGDAWTGAHVYVDRSGWVLVCYSGYPLRDPAARAFYPIGITPYRLLDVVRKVMLQGANISDPDSRLYDFSFPRATQVQVVRKTSPGGYGGKLSFTIPANVTVLEASVPWAWSFWLDYCNAYVDGEKIVGRLSDRCADNYADIALRRLPSGRHEIRCDTDCGLVLVLDQSTGGQIVYHDPVEFASPMALQCPAGLAPCGSIVTIPPTRTATVTWTPTPTSTPTPKPPQWKQLPSQGPSARYGHGLVFDARRHTLVLFGGDDSGTARLDDTWELAVGGTWRRRQFTQSPPGRVNVHQAMVYDGSRGRVVLFGGLQGTGSHDPGGYRNDTWENDGTAWTAIRTNVRPPARDAHAMVYDARRRVTVLFGGYSPGNTRLGDTWEYDGTTWAERLDVGAPPGRANHAMAYDSGRGVTVLFGGTLSESDELDTDTWEYDGTGWRRGARSMAPSPRVAHSLAYDPVREVVVLFGGLNKREPLADTWEYDGLAWREVDVVVAPAARGGTRLVYDSDRSAVVLFGGGHSSFGRFSVFDDLWQYQSDHQVSRFIPAALRN